MKRPEVVTRNQRLDMVAAANSTTNLSVTASTVDAVDLQKRQCD